MWFSITDRTDGSHPSASNIELQSRSSSRLDPGASGVEPAAGSHKSCEVILNGIINKDCDTTSDVINEIAYATLRTVHPSFARKNVLSARILAARDPFRRNGEEAQEVLESRPGALASCIVELSIACLVRELMRAKRSLANNYLSTAPT